MVTWGEFISKNVPATINIFQSKFYLHIDETEILDDWTSTSSDGKTSENTSHET